MKDKEFKKNKEDIVCPYENLTPYKEQRVCRYFEQAGDDNKNEFELLGREHLKKIEQHKENSS